MSIRSAPGGSPGWTRTGSARRSISAQMGANAGSVRLRPAMLAMTMTPTAPSSQVRRELLDRPLRVLPRQRGEPADPVPDRRAAASAIEAFDSRAASLLTSSPPQ